MTKRRLHHAATLQTGSGQYTSSQNIHVSIILCRGVIVSQALDEAKIMRLSYPVDGRWKVIRPIENNHGFIIHKNHIAL